MSDEIYRQIYSNLNLKDDEELLDIWKTNDRLEWSDKAFKAIEAILTERGVALPEQGEKKS